MYWLDRLDGKYAVDPVTQCWNWLRSKTKGYGTVKIDTISWYLHHYSWVQVNGPIPPGLHVLHSCDNPACFNPDHLFLGTRAINMADMAAKGRNSGPRHHEKGTKLSRVDVEAIRADFRLHREIAEDYGVTREMITNIKNRKRWK